MAKHGVATISTSTVGAGVRTCAADLPCARHQCVFDAAMAPAREGGLRKTGTSRLSERAEAGRTLDLSRLYSYEAGEQSERAHCGGIYRGKRSGAGGAKGGGQGECAPAKHALDSEPGSRVTSAGAYTAAIAVIHPRWEPYAGKPPVRSCGGGAIKTASLPLHANIRRRAFITLLGGRP